MLDTDSLIADPARMRLDSAALLKLILFLVEQA